MDQAQCKGLHVSEAEATTACQTCDPCQKLACLSCSKGNHVARGTDPTCSWETDIRTLFPSPRLSSVPCYCWYFFRLQCWCCFSSSIIWLCIPLWPLELSSARFSAFQTIYSLTVAYLFVTTATQQCQQSIAKVFDGPPTFPTIHRHDIVKYWIIPSKINSKRFLTLFLTSSQSAHLSEAVWSPKAAILRKGSSPFAYQLGNDQEKGVEGYINLFWKFKILPWPFLAMVHLLPYRKPRSAGRRRLSM